MAPEKKRRKLNQIEEITFDPAARREYLTGFHKRKQERVQLARDTAVKRAREERVKERRQLREQRKEDLDKHIAAINAELRKQNADADASESAPVEVDEDGEEGYTVEDDVGAIEQDEEYVDEDKYTTVTVEAMDPLNEEPQHEEVREAEVMNSNGDTARVKQKRIWSKDNPKTQKKVKKKRQFRYESKADRQATRQKQKMKSSRAAKVRREGG